MPKFRKKPVVIEAVQVTANTGERLPEGFQLYNFVPPNGAVGFVDTLEGRMDVRLGDWIITGVKGEKYPCKPDIFAATYEPVKQEGGSK